MENENKDDDQKIIVSKEHIRFAVLATDIAFFTIHDKKLFVRVIPVDRPPHFIDREGLPGGLILPKETAEESAMRILLEKTKIIPGQVYIEQLYTFSSVDRDPRGRVVSVAYLALVPWETLSESEREGQDGSHWIALGAARDLAYDHDEVLAVALARLRMRVTYTTLLSKLMPKEFTLTDLEETYETVLGRMIDKRNFRKKIEKLGILEELPHKREGGRHRPARLYRFATTKVKEIEIL